jgi:hypothetical protein
LTRYANPADVLEATAPLRLLAYELGDLVTVTTKRAPSSDMNGITNVTYQIVQREVDYPNSRMKFTLLRA